MYKNKCMIREQTENTNDNQINQVNISKTIYINSATKCYHNAAGRFVVKTGKNYKKMKKIG